jgi:exopolysaccharide biosynthesis polyprenyl glycosylphosphotransferase
MVSPVPIIILYVIDIVISAVVILICARLYDYWYVPYNMVMIYGTDKSVGMKLKTDTRRDRYRVNKMIHYKTGFQNICQQIREFDAVLINDVPAQNRNDILKYCYEHHIRAYVVPKISDLIVRGAKSVNAFDTPLMVVEGSGLNLSQRVWKRAMDIVLGSIAMVVASPIMLVVAIAIKLDDHGPVFYKQTRVTLNGKKFDILKFRSMIVNAEKDGHSIPAKDGDPRITRVGRVIRATRIDELPQILNILKGDMSIVGPRPERVEHMELYCKEIPEFRNRLKVKGGLTGYAQIFGKYNTTAYDKLRLDMIYIENYSLLLDLKLIVLTLRVMLQKESTEGFDKVEENEERLNKLLHEMREEDDSYQEELTTDRR